LTSQRREVVIVCGVLHGLSAFAERAAPEMVFDVLGAYHQAIGPLITAFDGTLQQLTGESLMVVFNAPSTCSAPIRRATEMAIAMRQQIKPLAQAWQSKSCRLDVGIGIAHGDATLGMAALDGQWDYVVVGSVWQLATRLGERAKSGAILVSPSVWESMHGPISGAPAGHLEFTGQTEALPFFEISGD
jgi:class 3 adenylate cyclase